jgi:hypothetical protein
MPFPPVRTTLAAVEVKYVRHFTTHPTQNIVDRILYPYQWLRFIFDPFIHLAALEEAEVIPGKGSDTRIKPLALTNGHGRYMAVTPERALASVGECPLNIEPLNFWPFHFRNGRVTAV